jgi:hypothetical protein
MTKIVSFQRILLAGLIYFMLFTACNVGTSSENDAQSLPSADTTFVYPELPEGVNRVIFNVDKKTLILSSESARSVYLVKVNRSSSSVTAADTGGVVDSDIAPAQRSSSSSASSASSDIPIDGRPVSGVFTAPDGATVFRYDSTRNQEFNMNPPPISALKATGARANSALTPAASVAIVGDKKQFWIDQTIDSSTTWSQIDTTLRAESDHCNVWVADDNFSDSSVSPSDNKINFAQAREIAEKFNAIYSLETPVFGYEYGGGPGGNGGVDRDEKIQILVYDIDGDYKANQTSGTFGFFWQKDEYPQSKLDEAYGADKYKSNVAELFYIDAYFADYSVSAMVSTLVHEYQHMINFNVKIMRLGKNYSTWYDEMLSMLAEDVIDPLIGIDTNNDSHPINDRIYFFLDAYYRAGPTEWNNSTRLWTVLSYANVYGFGAYLARNFGGIQFLKEMSANDFVDEESISSALAFCSGNITGVTNFLQAVSRYGEALVYYNTSDSRGTPLSFNKTNTGTVSGTSYTFYGFDIFSMPRYDWSEKASSGSNGPLVSSTHGSTNIPPNSVVIFQNPEWKDKVGDLRITLKKPENPYIYFYLR